MTSRDMATDHGNNWVTAKMAVALSDNAKLCAAILKKKKLSLLRITKPVWLEWQRSDWHPFKPGPLRFCPFYFSRAELLASFMRASAWWMLPFARFVLTTDFCPATNVTSVSNVWYPGNSTLIWCVPGLSNME
jgi:hypothetical protein